VCVPKQSQHKSSSPAGCTRAREWAVGVGGQERLESLPHKSSPTKVGWQTRVSAPRRGAPHNDRLTQMWGRKAGSRPPARLPVWHARLRAPRERPVWYTRLRAPRERPVWQAQRRADTRVRPYRAHGWAEDRVVGEGGRGRQESRPQARKPAPQGGCLTKVGWQTRVPAPQRGLPHKEPAARGCSRLFLERVQRYLPTSSLSFSRVASGIA